MEVLYKNCCGLDVHKKIIVACVLTPNGKEIESFGTMTEDILMLVDLIKQKQCEAVAMESTGVYWKPIYNLLELEQIPTLVVNAQHIKNVPGRKTDVKDAKWIANLLKHGLLKGSYIPSREQRELREIVRYRRSLIEERSREINRLQKVLESANIKLSSVVSDILGVSSRAMIEAIINGVNDPKALSSLANKKLKASPDLLQKSLKGLIGEHQRKLISIQLKHIDFLTQQIEDITNDVNVRWFIVKLNATDRIKK
ncbi:IS110 family transposase [Fonticella tunisiensis]|uniref:Transposase n=1 Tax=Fonticella tunisiensis TaxID=1096341 RepID=A0A4R7KTW4_9CLOT|nr:IS110 family transposase [Fonticella tunisiensis]TDT63577.1 transposase [Fonticella tunisiensis]